MPLCPSCLQDVERFTESATGSGSVHTCPACAELVPLRYVRDYDRYPAVVFSLTGLRGHGKTCYLASLLHEFERIGALWPDFSYIPLDEEGLVGVRERQRALERGDLPESTRKVFPRPVLLRLEGLPDLGGCHLLMYDTAGEAFQRSGELRQYAGYVTRSRVVVFLVSLERLETPSSLVDFLTVYVQAVAELRGRPADQTLLVVLTQGDRLAGREDLPESIGDYLRERKRGTSLEPFAPLSQEIEGWLGSQPGFINFLRRARQEFGDVRYAVVSALGSDPEGQTQQVSVSPRGVLAPLLYVISCEKERWEVDRQRREQEERDAEAARQKLQAAEERQRQQEASRAALWRIARRCADGLSWMGFIGGGALAALWGWTAARGGTAVEALWLGARCAGLGAAMGVLIVPSLVLFQPKGDRRWQISTAADVALWVITGLMAGGTLIGLLCAILFGMGYALGR
jgi:hypothetical protein